MLVEFRLAGKVLDAKHHMIPTFSFTIHSNQFLFSREDFKRVAGHGITAVALDVELSGF